jgi:hypothetical protein
MGPLKLRGLKPGEWRELTAAELASLRKAAARVVATGAEGSARVRRRRGSRPART